MIMFKRVKTKKEFTQVLNTLYIIGSYSYENVKEYFPNIVVTHLLYSIRHFDHSALYKCFYWLIGRGYNPTVYHTDVEEIMLKNIVSIIDNYEKKNH